VGSEAIGKAINAMLKKNAKRFIVVRPASPASQ